MFYSSSVDVHSVFPRLNSDTGCKKPLKLHYNTPLHSQHLNDINYSVHQGLLRRSQQLSHDLAVY